VSLRVLQLGVNASTFC